jgi:hypothetical protein
MAGILGNNRSDAEMRVEAARKKAAAEAKADVAFGEKFSDTLGGYGRGALNYLRGGINDYAGLLAGIRGYEDFATDSNLRSDEFYRRGGEFFDKGLAGGQEFLDESSIPLTEDEKNLRIVADVERAAKQAQAAENTQAGEFAGMGTPLVDPMASGLDVEYQAENARQLQEKIAALAKSREGSPTRQSGEQIGERDMFQRAKAGPTAEDMALMEQAREQGQGGAELKEETVQNLFEKSMEDLLKMQGNQPKTENREELLEKYKQEFADATGVDISGKPDTSQALMAMGLSLMQNRAGKGFNVGKMLSAVGDAGQKAMPYVTKAASEAKAASLAAGKYALGRIKDGEASAAAFAKEVRAHNNAWNLEVMKLDAQAQIEAMKAKNDKSRNKLQNIKSFKIGAGDVEIQTGTFEDELGSRPVFVNGAADAGRITDAYKKYTEGQEYIVEMQDALTELSNRPEGPLPAKLIDKIKTFSVKLGLADPKAAFGEEGVSKAEEFEVYQQATINAFKKLILQESQVSNLDLTTLFASFGDASFMASPGKSKLAIDTMMDYFSAKKRTLQAPLSNMTERDWFQTETDYNRTQKLLSGIGISPSSPVATTDGGRYTLDLTAIPKLNETG